MAKPSFEEFFIFSRPAPNCDNDVAINMLNCVSAIMRGIEHDDQVKIDSAFKALKQDVADFEKIFHDNLVQGRYKR